MKFTLSVHCSFEQWPTTPTYPVTSQAGTALRRGAARPGSAVYLSRKALNEAVKSRTCISKAAEAGSS
jgi:hypothetical protein